MAVTDALASALSVALGMAFAQEVRGKEAVCTLTLGRDE